MQSKASDYVYMEDKHLFKIIKSYHSGSCHLLQKLIRQCTGLISVSQNSWPPQNQNVGLYEKKEKNFVEVIVLNIKVQIEFNSTLKGSYTTTKWDLSQESKGCSNIYKLISAIQHSNKMKFGKKKKQKHTITSIEAEEVSNKVQHPFMIKLSTKQKPLQTQ